MHDGIAAMPSSPFDLFFLFAPGLAACALVFARRGWRTLPVGARGRVLVAAGTGSAFLLVTSVPVPFGLRGAAIAQSGSGTSILGAEFRRGACV